jgi:hypothetical protein
LRERSRALLRERCDQLRALESRLQGQLAQLMADLDCAPPQAADPASLERIAALESEIQQLQRLRSDSEQALDEARVMLAEMEEERRALRERLDDRESRAPTPTQSSREEAEQIDRLQRRLEMAMQEIRELKDQNADLASRPVSAPPAHRPVEEDLSSFSWEIQKQRLLQQLETDFDARQPEQNQQKLRMEEVIRTTDRIIAEKNEEIEKLRQQLSQQPAHYEAKAADTVARAVDNDGAILAERERLTQIQEEWRGKLRKAEVEISIERAKLARERLQLEEKLRAVQSQTPPAAEESAKPDDPKGVNTRGRWLTRLGLSGPE